MKKTWPVIFLFIAIPGIPASLFRARLIDFVNSTPVLSVTPMPQWTILEKIIEAKQLLQGIHLKIGTQEIAYIEDRIAQSSLGGINTSKKSLKEVEKEIALAALNLDTGQIKILIIDKKGGDLIAPESWNIEILPRTNGIRWNAWNTSYRVIEPSGYAVIANIYPEDRTVTVAQKKGKKTVYIKQQTVDYVTYAPYSPDIHNADLVQAGKKYMYTVIQNVFSDLKTKGVLSKALPGLISDVFASRSQMFAQLPLLENTDPTEFLLDPQHTIERAEVIIGANQNEAFGHTCNGSSACGWVQFTPGTYANIVKSYPTAGLMKDFKTGAADHFNSMKAAILLYDENLRGLIKSQDEKVLNDPKLPEYLAASYNGAPTHTYKTLTASILSAVEDWINALSIKKGGLKSETQMYLVKLRYLQQNNLP